MKAQEEAKVKREAALKEKRAKMSKDVKKAINLKKKHSLGWFKLFNEKISEANTKAISEEDEYKKLAKYVPIEEE